MGRLACVNVAALPLQLLLRAHPAWSSWPVAVVEDDRPQALVLYMNARARRAGVRAGQRYATALALDRNLRAGAVSRSHIDEGVRTLADRLRRYSPHVEPASDTPGVFWLDVEGLGRLYPSLRAWADDVRADLRRVGMWSSVAVGFSRFGVYALAISHRDVVVSATAEEERARVRQVPLGRLDLDPDARDRLLALGIGTVGDFLRLPGGGIRARFGAAIGALHQLAAGRRWAPIVPVPAEDIHERTVDFDTPESHVERLIFVVKRLVDGLAAALAHQGLAAVELALHLTLDDRTAHIERVRPAAPTLDVAQLLTLVRLRLDALRLSSGIVTLRIVAGVCPATADQRRLFAEQTRRDPEAANQALARLRAECGERSVVRARLCDAHLPAARFTWEPILHVPARSAPRVVAARPLVRRIYTTPVPIGGTGLLDSRGGGAERPALPFRAQRLFGPYIVSGGWWTGREEEGVQRDYYFVQTPGGDLWWLYYDRRRQRFFLQGCVE